MKTPLNGFGFSAMALSVLVCGGAWAVEVESKVDPDSATGKPQLTITGAPASTEVSVSVTAGEVTKTYAGTTDSNGAVTIALSGTDQELAPETAYVYTVTTGSGEGKSEIATGAFETANTYFSAAVVNGAGAYVNGAWSATAPAVVPTVADGAFALTDDATFGITGPASDKIVTVTQTLTIDGAVDADTLAAANVDGAAGAIAIVEGMSGNEWRVLGSGGTWTTASGTMPELPATLKLTMTYDPTATPKTFSYLVKSADGQMTYLSTSYETSVTALSSVRYIGSATLAGIKGIVGVEEKSLEEGYVGVDSTKKLPVFVDPTYAARLGGTHAAVQSKLEEGASAGLKTWQAYLLGVAADKLAAIDLTARFVPGATANSLSFEDGYTARTGVGARVKRTILVGESLSSMQPVEPTGETAESVTITLPANAPKVNLFQIRYDFE